MSTTDPVVPPPAPTISVAYQSPGARALSTAQRAALSSLIASIITAILTGLLRLLQGGDFTQVALQAAGVAIVTAILTSLLVFVQKYFESQGDSGGVPPAASYTVPVPAIPPAPPSGAGFVRHDPGGVGIPL